MSLDELLQRIDISRWEYYISQRQDFTWQHIQKNNNIPWSVNTLSRLAPLEYIENHPNKSWDYIEISKRTDLTIDFIKIHKDKLYWWFISRNINFQDVLDNIDLPWDYKGLSWNTQISSNDLIEYPDLPWNYSSLSEHIDLEFIYANPSLPWDYEILFRRVHMWFIRQNPEINKNYWKLSDNPNLTIDYIMENLNKPWNWDNIFNNTNITLEDLITNNLPTQDIESFQFRYPEYCIENNLMYDWIEASQNASLDIINKYPNKPWNKSYLSKNNNMTIDYVLEHPEIDWSFRDLSIFNQITLQDVLDHWELPWDLLFVIQYKY